MADNGNSQVASVRFGNEKFSISGPWLDHKIRRAHAASGGNLVLYRWSRRLCWVKRLSCWFEDQVDLRSLQSKGYAVIEAGNGEEAINRAKEFRGDIHLMLTDMIMPRLGGLDAARLIRSVRPAMKVIYMSGYADNTILRPDLLSNNEGVLEKPITPDELVGRTREMMEETRA